MNAREPEEAGFWQWLSQGLVETIRAFPALVGVIRSPRLEFFIGLLGTPSSLIFAILFDVPFYTRFIIALCAIPSFIIMMHGIYRAKGNW